MIKSYKSIFILSIFLSIVFVTLAIYYYPTISTDSSMYLLGAQVFSQFGLKAVLHGYSWAFYILLTWLIHTVTNLSLVHSVYLQNYMYFTLLVLAFLGVVKQLGGKPVHLWWALFSIFSFHYVVKLSFDGIRDNGYLCFFMLSIWAAFKFYERRLWRYGVLWAALTIMAMLYRIEAVVFLVLLPLVLMVFNRESLSRRAQLFVKMYLLSLGLGFGVMIPLLIVHPHTYAVVFSKLYSYIPFFKSISVSFSGAADNAVKHGVLLPQMVDEASVFLFFGLLGTYVYMLLATIGVAQVFAAGFAWIKLRCNFKQSHRLLLGACFCIYLAVTLIYMFAFRFIDQRYYLGFGLVILVVVPFALQSIFDEWRATQHKRHWKNWLFPIIFLLMLYSLMSSVIHFGPSKRYIIHAADWVDANTPKDAVIFTQSARLPYYINRKSVGWRCSDDNFGPLYQKNGHACFSYKQPTRDFYNAQYAVFDVTHKKDLKILHNLIKQQPIKVFHSNRFRRILIYELAVKPIKTITGADKILPTSVFDGLAFS